MNAAELGFLLLCCDIGDGLPPLTLHRLELLRRRMQTQECSTPDRELDVQAFEALGYKKDFAENLAALFAREEALDTYLALGAQRQCYPLSCVSPGFPPLRTRLGSRCPAVLFYRGNLSLLQTKRIALVGSRKLNEQGKAFAVHIGQLAAEEGYTLVSGNAIGADKTAQKACLACGGSVIAVVSEPLYSQPQPDAHILYLSESGWHQAFTPVRALSRNRLIYALGERSFVAQCAPGTGTRKGCEDALKHGISPVYVHDDGSEAAGALAALGAHPVLSENLQTLACREDAQIGFFLR